MEEKRRALQDYAKMVEDEVVVYLQMKKCVNKLDARTILASRVLDLISKLELMSLEFCSFSEEAAKEQKNERDSANKLRAKIYESLKEY